MRILLIVNPMAGGRSRRATADAVAAAFAAGGWEVTMRLTAGPESARQFAREGAAGGFDAVFACGGDGTLSEIVTGLLDTGVPAGIIPTGTGNDFARTIGLPLEPLAAVESHLGGSARSVDLLEVDGGTCWAINVMGAGFDARVAHRVNVRTRFTGGFITYLACVGAELVVNRPTTLELTVDGEKTWSGPALLAAVANARSYGGGMLIAPHAEIDDGLVDAVLVEHMTTVEFAVNFPKVMRGTHLSHPAVHAWRGSEVVLETPEPAPVLVDGDLKAETPLTVRVAPGRARLWLPEPTNE